MMKNTFYFILKALFVLKILKFLAVAKVPVPVTANINIRVPRDLKLQLRRQTCTLIFT